MGRCFAGRLLAADRSCDARQIAVVDNHGASYTYSALDHAASCLANWMLAKGIESGDRIAFQLPGWCEFTVIYLACLKIGAVSVPAVAFLAGSRTGVGAQ
ncbi:short-chain-fatty-acid--CoA ligase (acyl-CoA synthetase) [Escherichia coli]|nr:short-chain-fatty-acid--CoA ligase (acyl-CoA synthetase) [Escherichia coli]